MLRLLALLFSSQPDSWINISPYWSSGTEPIHHLWQYWSKHWHLSFVQLVYDTQRVTGRYTTTFPSHQQRELFCFFSHCRNWHRIWSSSIQEQSLKCCAFREVILMPCCNKCFLTSAKHFCYSSQTNMFFFSVSNGRTLSDREHRIAVQENPSRLALLISVSNTQTSVSGTSDCTL